MKNFSHALNIRHGSARLQVVTCIRQLVFPPPDKKARSMATMRIKEGARNLRNKSGRSEIRGRVYDL